MGRRNDAPHGIQALRALRDRCLAKTLQHGEAVTTVVAARMVSAAVFVERHERMVADQACVICDNRAVENQEQPQAQSPMERSKQPVWLITGAAGTLGRELVHQVLTEGADCIALDRDERGLNQLHDRLANEGLRPPALYPLDLVGASPDDYADLAATVNEHFGCLDVLVHAAASFSALRPLEHQAADEWFGILQSGLTGPFLLTNALMPLLRASGKGCMVWINNTACLTQPARWGAYGVSQAGRRQMVMTLAAELGPRGPRVLEVDPGPFYGPLRSAAWPAETPHELPGAAQAAQRVLQTIRQGEQ